MSNLPDVFLGSPASRQLARATRARESSELTIYGHALDSHVLAECDRIDSEATAQVISTAMEQEIATLKHGLQLANGSAAAAELVARLSSLHSRIDTQRIARRLG
jgi:hypothetical protein